MSSKNFYGLTGDVTVDGGILNVGNAQLYANTETSNVGIGTPNPEFQLDVRGDANVHNLYATYLHGDGSNIENIVSSQWEGSPGDPIYYTSNVGIANTAPVTKTLQVGSNLYVEDAGSNVLHVTGNVYADYFVGDGSQLTGIAASLDQIVDQGNTVSNTIQIVSGQDATSNIGLVTHEGVSISVSNANPTGEYQFGVGSNLLVNVYSSNVLTVDGNVFAQKMTLGTVTVTPAYNLQQIMTTGATTNQTLVLSNVTTGLTTSSNVGIANTAPVHTLDVGSNLYVEDTGSNVLTVTGNASVSNLHVSTRLDVGSNLHIENLRVAEVASNLVTYDSTTGELMDSGGLFSNKLAVVSEQPPIALTGASTVVTNHGTYTIEASSGTVTELFDKNISTVWTTSQSYNTLDGSYTGSTSLADVDGEWAKITMPYKTILRHVKIESTNSSIKDVTLVGLNADGLTWTTLKTENNLNEETSTIIVNATTHHKTYGLIVRATNVGSSQAEIGDLKLFTESFSIDGGKVEMASSAVMGGETTMDQHGPHGRGEAKLKKYPEIIFENGKFDRNDSTNTYTQAGYTVTASSQNNTNTNAVYCAFDGVSNGINARWRTQNLYVDNETTANPSALDPSSPQTQLDTNTSIGEYLILEVPKKIKLKNIVVNGPHMHMPYEVDIYGRNEGVSTWTHVKNYTYTIPTGTDDSVWNTTNQIIDATGYYSEYAFVIVKTNGHTGASIGELQLYGYEEDPPAGDTSVDTTFTSIMNTPQTTGANVYVDGNLGETFTNRVTGPDVTGPSATYDSTGKYWELNGSLESNIAVEANTFLSGDQPHSVSVWFNSSNLEANVSNTCVFSVSDQEKLDSVNLDLQSNTWHNLTYAYQGEGGSRVTYLDGRKVAEDQAEDTFGDYPPFAMTGPSQGGYVVSASAQNGASFPPWKAFNNENGSGGDSCWSVGNFWNATDNFFSGTTSVGNEMIINLDGVPNTTVGGVGGHWINLELPHRLIVDYVEIHPRYAPSADWDERVPEQFYIVGSNDGYHWYTIHYKNTNGVPTIGTPDTQAMTGAYSNIGFKNIRMYVTKVGNGQNRLDISIINYYGHRENDLVRLPDPTNVLKYPHVAMTGQPGTANGVSDIVHAQRGYVVTASSMYVDNSTNPFQPWRAFNNETGSSINGSSWVSTGLTNTYGGANNTYGTVRSANLGSDSGGTATENGEWLKVQLPHKIVLSHIQMVGNSVADTSDHPKSFKLYGSINGTTWVEVISVTNTGSQDTSVGTTFTPVSTPDAYNYFGLIVTATQSRHNYVTVTELKLYGTEEATSVPLQIGGGNIDKVANFRVYDKFVGEDQALEIWDAQKDEFGRAKSSMTLQKGRLGIGTTEPEGRLAVADEPHNLEEFPPRAMTGYKNYFEGHGEFCVSVSSDISGNYPGWEAFDKKIGAHFNDPASYRSSFWAASNYDSNGIAENGVNLSGIPGHWIKLQMPYYAFINKLVLYDRENYLKQAPKVFKIVGSRDDINWDILYEQNATSFEPFKGTSYNLPHTKSYKYMAVVIYENYNVPVSPAMSIGELRYFGTREQGQSVLHDGQLTLTKSLTVPRIGPALDADDTPRRDRLVVEYNTSTNPTFEGAVRDTSGRGNDGVFYGTNMNYSSTDKAFEFNGTSDYTRGGILTNMSGDKAVSYSVWIKADTLVNTMIVALGEAGVYGTNGKTGGIFMENSGTLYNTVFANGIQVSGAITIGNWIHIVATKVPGGSGIDTQTLYVNGLKPSQSNWGTPGTSLSLDDPVITLGASPNLSQYFNGSISNFKLYDCALTAEEVKTLYDMGRNGSVANPQPLHIAAPLYSPGTIVQVEQAVKTDTSAVTSTSVVDIGGLSVDITPKFSTSKILVSYIVNVGVDITGTSNMHGFLRVKRTQGGISTYIGDGASSGDRQVCTSYIYNTLMAQLEPFSFEHLDDANGTGTVTYTIQGLVESGLYTMTINRSGSDGDNGYYGRTTSSITVKEVCQ
jgi:hypothetical protein